MRSGFFYLSGVVEIMYFYGVQDPNIVDRWAEKKKGKMIKILQDGLIIPNILSVCKFFIYV